MAIVKGQLGAVNISSLATLTAIYLVPALKEASVNVTIANRSDVATNIRLAHIKNAGVGSVALEDYLIYDLPTTSLASNFAPISVTGILMEAGDTIAVLSSATNVSVQVNGIEGDV